MKTSALLQDRSLVFSAIAVVIVAIFMLAAHLVSTMMFFGTLAGQVITLSAPFAVVVFSMMLARNANKDIETAAVAACIMAVLCSFALLFSPSMRASSLATNANYKIDFVSEMIGHDPAIAPAIREMTTNISTVQENRDFLEQVQKASTDRQAITYHLAIASQLGVDTSFVSANAMVRPQDEHALFRRALDLAEAGNQQAVAFLQDNRVPTR